ncbi:MAG TPA: hypothetical protein VHO69_07715, partial [Phototrophicaceae bacterium]|nr:hypothetical protein [Phototrophicaceae bacterium]
GRAGERYFVLRADMGLTTRITQDADRELKDRYGILAYAMAAVNALTQAEPIHYRLTIDGSEIETEGIACLVANVSDIGAFNLTLDKRVDPGDGLLDVFVATNLGESLRSMAADLLRLQEGAAAGFQRWQAREVAIQTDPPQPVYADGDEFSHTPLTIQVVPGALKVLVAREEEKA